VKSAGRSEFHHALSTIALWSAFLQHPPPQIGAGGGWSYPRRLQLMPEPHGAADPIDSEAVWRVRTAIAGLVADMNELRALREEHAALRERHRAIEREIEKAEDVLSDLERKRPVPLWLALVRGLLRPDRQSTRRDWHGYLLVYAKVLCTLTILFLLAASR